ncbi:aldo/keto reductase [Aquisalimonas asiatica]|uniref:Aldo/keto reductase n=1 Tax=Aquisalimonas asiatica TaxID=406100 RepID=A0A1H8RX63_9GAMM|nr:aldo/keto reductase [Aquisalimonas asiatica]SEO70887.1 Aldo/keto reductase [Aquisalimonas asiatica]
MRPFDTRRRQFLQRMADGAVAAAAWRLRGLGVAGALAAPVAAHGSDDVHRKTIPGTDETLNAIGMGTYITFNVGPDDGARESLTDVLRTFFAMGGGMIDSSPMYGTAEDVLGDLLGEMDDAGPVFSATKVWTRSTGEGREQIDASLDLWGVDRFDLMQIHNLVNWEAHLETLRERRADGDIRYIGVTTSHGRRHDALERIMRDEAIDFVQLTYNIVDREAEERLLPLARERDIAVIANRPFQRGNLFDRVNGKPLPGWAADYGIENWAQYFLKFITSHDAITCAIPATSREEHMRENMGALRGPVPDASVRERMLEELQRL